MVFSPADKCKNRKSAMLRQWETIVIVRQDADSRVHQQCNQIVEANSCRFSQTEYCQHRTATDPSTMKPTMQLHTTKILKANSKQIVLLFLNEEC